MANLLKFSNINNGNVKKRQKFAFTVLYSRISSGLKFIGRRINILIELINKNQESIMIRTLK